MPRYRIRERQEQVSAVQVFDLEDQFARERGLRGLHPRPTGRISFFVVGQVINGETAEFVEPVKLVTQLNPSGYHLFFGVFRLLDGIKRRSYLAGGTYVVRVESDYYQTAEQQVEFPMSVSNTPTFFDLLPGYAYPFPKTTDPPATVLRGYVHDAQEKGVAAVKIEIVGTALIYSRTDETGQWLVVFSDPLPSGSVVIRYTLDEETKEDRVAIVPGGNKAPSMQFDV